MESIDKILSFLKEADLNDKRTIFKLLRSEISIHPIENEWNAQAEIILEAIHRSNDLTKRGIRGIIAEASFKYIVIDNLQNFEDITPSGDLPFDFLIRSSEHEIKIQVKMQRLKTHRPMMANEGYRILSSDKYVVETQKTRGGLDTRTNENTRPYRFGEFDILAVSMHPSTNDWSKFFYTVSDWLLPRQDSPDQLLKFQPVPQRPNEDWTDDFETVIQWHENGIRKKIQS